MAGSVDPAPCPPRFLLLTGEDTGEDSWRWGGVLVRWTCGAERTAPDEEAVDVDVLRSRFDWHECLNTC